MISIVLEASQAGGTAKAWQEVKRHLMVAVDVARDEPSVKRQQPVRTGHAHQLERLSLILAKREEPRVLIVEAVHLDPIDAAPRRKPSIVAGVTGERGLRVDVIRLVD